MVDLPLEQLLNFGEADLKANMARFVEVAALVDADKSPAEVMAEIAADHPAADALIPETRDMLEDIRQYIIDCDIVSVPSEVRCRTVPTPSFMRWAFAALDFPGPYEQNADETFYYVTSVEEHWSDDEKEQWMTSFNYATLRAVSVHEAYPGHYVHYLHTLSADSMISRAFGGVFVLGGLGALCGADDGGGWLPVRPTQRTRSANGGADAKLPLHLRHQDAHAGHDNR